MTFEEMKNLSEEEQKDLFEKLDEMRSGAKTVNFSCLPVGTKVLTPTGWVDYKDIAVGSPVYSMSMDTLELEVDSVKRVFFYKDSPLVSMENMSHKFVSTPNHDWVSRHRTTVGGERAYKIRKRKTFEIAGDDNIIVSAPWINKETKYRDEDVELLAWILSDGWIYWSKRGDGPSRSNGRRKHVILGIGQKDNVSDLEKSLSGFKYHVYSTPSGLSRYVLIPSEARKLIKRLGLPRVDKKYLDLEGMAFNMSYDQREIFLDTFNKGDGSIIKHYKVDGGVGEYKIICQNRGNILDLVVMCATLNGHLYSVTSNGQYKDFENVNLRFKQIRHVTGQKLLKTDAGVGDVFCIETGNGTFVAKQGDNIFVTGNSTYGVRAPRLSKDLGVSVEEAQGFLDAFWDRNRAIKEVEERVVIRTIKDQMWLYNPVAKMWYSLRYKKDIFSTLNQGTGDFCFNMWLGFVRKSGIKVSAQFHDEMVYYCDEGEEVENSKVLKECIAVANKHLRLNVKLDVDTKFGKTYSEVH